MFVILGYTVLNNVHKYTCYFITKFEETHVLTVLHTPHLVLSVKCRLGEIRACWRLECKVISNISMWNWAMQQSCVVIKRAVESFSNFTWIFCTFISHVKDLWPILPNHSCLTHVDRMWTFDNRLAMPSVCYSSFTQMTTMLFSVNLSWYVELWASVTSVVCSLNILTFGCRMSIGWVVAN